MVMKGSQIVDVALTPGEKGAAGFLTPIVGVENGLQLDYDRNNERIFWIEAITKDAENVRYITFTVNVFQYIVIRFSKMIILLKYLYK